jgi:hypothetical protein
MSVSFGLGRFCNQVTRNLAANLLARKFNLQIRYQNYDEINKLGFKLFSGENNHEFTACVDEERYKILFNSDPSDVKFNINMQGYFQTKFITSKIHDYLNSDDIMNNIINNNKHGSRYNNNNDCFIHIRLGDVKKWNPGFEYYNNILSKLKFEHLYIATDSPNDEIINKLLSLYPNSSLYDTSLSDIILFGSTCKYVILSYGTFSAIIGYISFYSTVYCLKYCEKYAWDYNDKKYECDMFQFKKTKICDWIING